MASPSAPVHSARYLSVFLAMLIGAYLLVFLTGDKHAEPKLGIDLQGGTRVTLTARTPDGSAPSREALLQAQQIIGARVNGLGVSGSEVVIDGPNLIITVPGGDGNEARNLGQTARLYIRPVIQAIPARPAPAPGSVPGRPGQVPPGTPPGQTPPAPGEQQVPPGAPSDQQAPADEQVPARQQAPAEQSSPAEQSAPPEQQAPARQSAPAEQPSPAEPSGPAEQSGPGDQSVPLPPQPRPYPLEPVPTPTPEPAPGAPGGPQPPAPGPGPLAPGAKAQNLAKRIELLKQLRQSANPRMQLLAMRIQSISCDKDDPLAGNDDPNLPLVTCSQDHKTAYLLAPSIISGDQIQNASSGVDQQNGANIVELQYKSAAATIWSDFTATHVGTQTAFTLDSQVVSAPVIQEAIPGGRTRVTGDFTQAKARDLANVLKYGSLPLSFESSQAETVSATLGLTSLRAGLIAGAIGLVLVLVYSLLYYRALGVLTALSLVASGAMVFAILVLLGRYINYTLDLAGIAGLIIGIGTTADSFVVFFERIKDEIREGRSFRSAVPRGWARARKTILSGNAVTFLAAAVLYFLAVGQVKGFAFTLGLTTILDVVVVFLVTWPLLFLASKSAMLAKPSFNGLGAVQQVARERRATAGSTAHSAERG